ncbi:hypothetical protein ACROYT_G025969 [Oculina patagonica]
MVDESFDHESDVRSRHAHVRAKRYSNIISGPLLPEALDVKNIPFVRRKQLTINLCGGEEWKFFAEKLGLTPAEIRFLDKRLLDPCDAALAHSRNQGYIACVGDLYDALVDCELPVLADLL